MSSKNFIGLDTFHVHLFYPLNKGLAKMNEDNNANICCEDSPMQDPVRKVETTVFLQLDASPRGISTSRTAPRVTTMEALFEGEDSGMEMDVAPIEAESFDHGMLGDAATGQHELQTAPELTSQGRVLGCTHGRRLEKASSQRPGRTDLSLMQFCLTLSSHLPLVLRLPP